MTKKEITIQTLKDNPTSSSSEIAELLIENYPEVFKDKSLSTVGRYVRSTRKDAGIKNPVEDIKKKIVKVKDTELEISKNDWLKQNQEVRNLKEKLNEKEKAYTVITKELDAATTYIDELSNELPKLPVIKEIPKYKVDTGKMDEEVVMLLSDLHAGEVVDPYEMEGMNEYNFDIFCKRLYFYCEKTIEVVENQRNISNIKKLWIDGLGDLMHGELHQPETNEHSLVSTALNTAFVISQAIAMLSRHFSEIELTGVVGNHGRFEKKPPTKRIYNNWDYLAYQQIAIFLMGYKNIKFNIPQSPSCIVKRMDHTFLLTHGDSIKGNFSGIPVYGMYRAFTSEQDIRRHTNGFDYMEIGHYHQDIKLKDGRFFVNGSMVGNNQYNLYKLHTVSDASQKIFGINKKYGVSWERTMKLDNAKDHKFIYKFDDNPVFSKLLNDKK